jgi:hypothetical protein
MYQMVRYVLGHCIEYGANLNRFHSVGLISFDGCRLPDFPNERSTLGPCSTMGIGQDGRGTAPEDKD